MTDLDVLPLWGHQRLALTPEALGFVELLTELGHVDAKLLEAFQDELSPPVDALTDQTRELDRDEVRRLLGTFLFSRQAELPPERLELLGREWPLLFG
ncbi:MAG: hypothetical protein GY913_03975 [Proteobacteria bacterium]|nr:hypothetical protein [Pseudomonadota bacterium]MCP4916060.1 hypothetical protein [Pseudomonadota bacterium]